MWEGAWKKDKKWEDITMEIFQVRGRGLEKKILIERITMKFVLGSWEEAWKMIYNMGDC